MLQANFTVTPLTGYVLATDFTVTNQTSGSIVKKYVWDFGIKDLIYDTPNPSYTYNYPGIYTIILSAIDINGNISTATQEITAELAYRDYIRFTEIPERFADPGKLTKTPFKIEVVTCNVNTPIKVDLFASNSNSTPYQFVPEKWSFLTPTWKFLDTNNNTITELNIPPTPIYKNNRVVAISGSAEFYFVDSTSNGNPINNCPILITANLQTSGYNLPFDSNIYPYNSYANNQTARTGTIWQVNDLIPNIFKVTGNYIDPINKTQWTKIKIPTLITCHSNRSILIPGAENSISEPIFTYPKDNTTGKLNPITLTLSGIDTQNYTIDDAPLYFQTNNEINSRIGGYIFTTVTSQITGNDVFITANGIITNNQQPIKNVFPYPEGFGPNTSVWISNPQKNTLNKITLIPDSGKCNTINFYRENGILVDGTIKEVQVPSLSTTSTFNYQMSGFSGIYGIAIDPRDYSVVAADSELDRLYRFSDTGTLLKTLELSTLDTYNPHKKMYDFWSWVTPVPEISANRFAFYKPVPLASDPNNYIVTLGGVIIPNDYIEIIKYEKVIRIVVTELSKFIKPNPSSNNIYPYENLEFNVIQLFNPTLPQKYISTLKHWTYVLPFPTNTFSLTGNPELSSNSSFYIVSIDGIIQRPETYTVNNTTKNITFGESVFEGSKIHVLYMPLLASPANWTYTFTSPTTSIFLTENPLYQKDSQSEFLINIGGVLQHPQNYSFDSLNQKIIFKDILPINVPISIVQLSIPDTIDNPIAFTPASVTLDKDSNIWVTLFNSVSVLKFDPNFNLLFNTVPNNITWQKRAWTNNPQGIDYQTSRYALPTRYDEPESLTIDPYTDEFFLKPPTAETDRYGNCWVTYAHPLCSLLVKYNSNGEPIFQIATGTYSIPTGLSINYDNNIWVSNFHGSSYTNIALSGSLQLYDTNTGTLLSSIVGIERPGNLSIDRNNNLWFTTGVRNIGYYNTTTSTLCTWLLSSEGFTPVVNTSAFNFLNTTFFEEYESREDDQLGGLAVDVFDRVWVLDGLYNQAWTISATPNFNFAPIRNFKIIPEVTLGYYIDVKTGETYTKSENFLYKSAQATGDWTGNRWYQKYVSSSTLSSIAVSGISNSFNIIDFKNNNQIRRVNESFNNAEYIKNLALPENLQSNTILFDKFFTAAVGTGYLSANEDLGQNIYERIANFVTNHSDIDTCNITQLLSLAENTGVAASDYAAFYPSDIRNMLDIASISRAKLWGVKDNTLLLPQCICDQLNTETDTITAGTKIILRSKLDNSLSIVTIPSLNNELVYPLKSFEGFGFAPPVIKNYLFYSYKPVFTDEYIENIIDWNSEFTTLSPTMSTFEQWYGDEGAIETAFRYLLTKNLFPK